MSDPVPGWLTTRAAAAYLSLSPRTLEHLRSAGNGPPFRKIGRHVRYSRADVDAWMQQRTVSSTAGGVA